MTPESIKLLHDFEGCELEAYKCPAGVWTIGYGLTRYPDGEKVKEADKITKDEADDYFAQTVAWFEKQVDDLIFNPDWKTESRLSALTCLAYNIGVKALKDSTVRVRIESKQNDDSVAEAWRWWNKINGKTSNGLVRRRTAEIDLWKLNAD